MYFAFEGERSVGNSLSAYEKLFVAFDIEKNHCAIPSHCAYDFILKLAICANTNFLYLALVRNDVFVYELGRSFMKLFFWVAETNKKSVEYTDANVVIKNKNTKDIKS